MHAHLGGHFRPHLAKCRCNFATNNNLPRVPKLRPRGAYRGNFGFIFDDFSAVQVRFLARGKKNVMEALAEAALQSEIESGNPEQPESTETPSDVAQDASGNAHDLGLSYASANGGGRAGIVLNGSPLFTGAAESGPSKIRQWLLESDLVEAIIALPTNMFFNTGIATYIWVLDNTKRLERSVPCSHVVVVSPP